MKAMYVGIMVAMVIALVVIVCIGVGSFEVDAQTQYILNK